MSRKTFRELGWETRRLTIMLRPDEWKWIDAYAAKNHFTVADVVADSAAMEIKRAIGDERVSLTPEGEAALSDTPELGSRVVREWGRTE